MGRVRLEVVYRSHDAGIFRVERPDTLVPQEVFEHARARERFLDFLALASCKMGISWRNYALGGNAYRSRRVGGNQTVCSTRETSVLFFSRFSTMGSNDFCANFVYCSSTGTALLATKRNISRTLHAGCAVFSLLPETD